MNNHGNQENQDDLGWPQAHILAVFDLGMELLDIMRARQRDVLDHLQCIIYHVRWNSNVIALNDANDRLIEAERDLEDALEQFMRVCTFLRDFQGSV